jgi:hypothetical protein
MATVSVYFPNPKVARVIINQLNRLKTEPDQYPNDDNPHCTNPHVTAVSNNAPLADITKPHSPTNPYTATFDLTQVPASQKPIFYALGLDAKGNVVATLSRAPKS